MLALTRDQAYQLLVDHVAAESLRKHCAATEAIMRALARRFGEDEELWGIAGLLHDIDLEQIDGDMTRHGLVAADLLAEQGMPAAMLQAVKAHNGEVLGIERTSRMDYALSAAESITGLVSAAALILPSRRLADVKAKSLAKRMKESRFAANVSRERIRHHEQLDMTFEEFAELSLRAMSAIAEQLGLQ